MLFPKSELQYSRTRISRQDGSYYDVAEVIAPDPAKVEFHKGISSGAQFKLDDIGQLRMLKAQSRGVKNPVVLVWDAYGHDEAMTEIDLAKHGQHTDLVPVSKNAYITRRLRSLVRSCNYLIKEGRLAVKELKSNRDAEVQRLLDLLYAEERIKLYQGDPAQSLEEVYANFDPMKDVVAVGKIGLPSFHGRTFDFPVVFNTSYFLFEEEDYISEFSILGDAYSLEIREGVIESPPLFNRSALLFTAEGEASLRQISLQDLKLNALGREFDLAAFSLNQPGKHALYTRYLGVEEAGRTYTQTPKNEKKIEFTIIDRSIVGFKRGGETEIPHNGFVLSLPEDELEAKVFANEVSYAFLTGEKFQTGIQCGPGLLKDGKISLDEHTLKREQFFRKKLLDGRIIDFGVVPTDYAEDIDYTRAARLAIGVDFEGRFRVLAAESVNAGMAEVTGESSGATLRELALVLKSKGYKHALNMDGGGSANIQYYYGQLVKGADRRGLPGVMYERFVPSVGVIREK